MSRAVSSVSGVRTFSATTSEMNSFARFRSRYSKLIHTAPRRNSAKTIWRKTTANSVRMNWSVRNLFAKAVTDAANRFQYARISVCIEFVSEVFDMHVNHVTEGGVIEVPEM